MQYFIKWLGLCQEKYLSEEGLGELFPNTWIHHCTTDRVIEENKVKKSEVISNTWSKQVYIIFVFLYFQPSFHKIIQLATANLSFKNIKLPNITYFNLRQNELFLIISVSPKL